MNPATDVGKRSLTEGCRNRFTEIFVDEPTSKHDLLIIVDEYLNRKAVSPQLIPVHIKLKLVHRTLSQLSGPAL